MPTYRVFVDDNDTGDYVTASSMEDAYFDVASSLPLTYKNTVRLEEVGPGESDNTIRSALLPVRKQELQLPDSNGTNR